MGLCCIQSFLLFFLLGFTPYSDTLICMEGVMVKFGVRFPKAPVDWVPQETKIAAPNEACYETLMIIDVGPKSLLVWSKGTGIPTDEDVQNIRLYDYWSTHLFPDNGTIIMYSEGPGILAAMYHETCHTDRCNSDNTTQVLLRGLRIAESYHSKSNKCPVCLHYRGSCRKNFVFCPKDTGCYDGEISIEGGKVNASFSIKGCLDLNSKDIFKKDETLGIFSMLEKVNSVTVNSFSHMFVPVTSLIWVLGLRLSLALCL